MSRWPSLVRLLVFTLVAVLLGYLVERDPERITLTLPERGVTVAVPKNLEGWALTPGEGDLLVEGETRLGLVSLEIVEVPVRENGDIDGFIVSRHKELKVGREEYIVWHQGMDSKFGYRPAPTYKATYEGKIGWWPFPTEIWQYDVYWPYRGHYARISMRYPDFLVNYVYMDRLMIAGNLKLD